MEKSSLIILSSLKDQVYEYLRHQMKIGEIRPGSPINMELTSKKLGVSKTPLRDALLQLGMEGFVTILPRRSVIVNKLTLQDIKDYYQILGALESTAIIAASEIMTAHDIKKMANLNEGMKMAIEKDNFNSFYEKNLMFHDVYINQAGNKMLRRTVDILKKRLYDFPRREGYIREWEEASIKEHQRLVNSLAEGEFLDAANFIRDVHWSFNVQEKFINKYYSIKEKNEG